MNRWTEKNAYNIMLAPLMLFLALMVVFPLLYMIYLSFTDWKMGAATPNLIGFKNYAAVLADKQFWADTKNTFYLAFLSVAVELILGTFVAVILNRPFFGKNVVKTLFLLPMVATPIAMGMVWQLIYDPTLGVANYLLDFLGIDPVMWLVDPNLVLKSIALIEVWEWTPMVMLIVLAGMAGMPADVYEAAKVDGANRFQIFRRVTLPLLRPTLIVTALMRIIDALKTFDIIYATTEGGPLKASETVNLYAYKSIFSYFKMGRGSALIICFLLEIGLVCALIMILRRKSRG